MSEEDMPLDRSAWTEDQLERLNFFELLVLATDGLALHAGGARANKLLLENLEIGSDDRVLEVGCGGGKELCKMVRKHHCRAVGIDHYDLIVKFARRRVQRFGLGDKIHIVRGDVTNLDFSDGEFDVVLAQGVMDTVADVKKAASEISRVLRPGGRFGSIEWRWLHEQDTRLVDMLERGMGVKFSPLKSEEWVALFEKVGLEPTYVFLSQEPGLPTGLAGVIRQDDFGQFVRFLGMMFMLVEWRPMRHLWHRTNSLEYLRWMCESGALGYGIYAYKKA